MIQINYGVQNKNRRSPQQNNAEMIHVCFGLSDKDGRYSKFTGTAMLSMFENTQSKVTAHILHDNTLSDDNREKLSYIAHQYNQQIKFYNVEVICAAEIARIKKLFTGYSEVERVTWGSFYRLLVPQLLSEHIEKIIYLDSDIIVNLDELWKINLDNNPVAAVPEIENRKDTKSVQITFPLCGEGLVSAENYFNAGILLMNLDQIRKNEIENLDKGISFLAKNFQYLSFDQDILNLCFSKKYLKLPHRFNFFPAMSRQRGDFQTGNIICHYAGQALNLDISDNFNKLWFSYFEKTPWFTKETVWHLDEFYRNIIHQREFSLKNLVIQISALMSGKTRAFFIPEPNIDVLKKIFLIRDDEEIIPLENQESFNTLANSMENSLGKKVFFILFEGYYQLRVALIQMGFVEGRDFINAEIFLTNANGVISKKENYKLVRNM